MKYETNMMLSCIEHKTDCFFLHFTWIRGANKLFTAYVGVVNLYQKGQFKIPTKGLNKNNFQILLSSTKTSNNVYFYDRNLNTKCRLVDNILFSFNNKCLVIVKGFKT